MHAHTRTSPTFSGLLTVCLLALAAPRAHAQGAVAAWGMDTSGQVSGAPGTGSYKAMAAGRLHNVAIRTDSSLIAWGYNSHGQVSATPTTGIYQAVAAGQYHSAAIRADGSLISWGSNSFGQVSGTPTTGAYTAIAAGPSYTLALRADGSIAAWGENTRGQVSGRPVTGVYTAIAAGDLHGVAVRSDGALVSWGYDGSGQVRGTPRAGTYVAVAAGFQHSVALRSDGALVAWGNDSYGQVRGTPTSGSYVAVGSGLFHSTALRSDGSIVSWGDDSSGQVSGAPAGPFAFVAGGRGHSVAIRRDLIRAPPQTGLLLWLRADAGVTSSGGRVSRWLDQTRNGFVASMTVGPRQPSLVGAALNGQPVIRFGGAQSLALSPHVSPNHFTLLIVGKNSKAAETYSMILGPEGNSPNNQLRWENGTQALFVGTGNNLPEIHSDIGNTRTYHALAARFDGSMMNVFRDGVAISSHPFTTSGPWTLAQIGAYYSEAFMEGDVAEILIYGSSLSDADMSAAASYVRSRYGLP